MYKNLKPLALAGVIALSFACSKKDNNPVPVASNMPAADAAPLSASQSDEAISSSSTKLNTELQAVNSTKSVVALRSLSSSLGAALPFGRMSISPGRSVVSALVKSFRSAIAKRGNLKNARVDGSLAQYKGVYVFDPAINDFKSPTASEVIVFIFPDSVNREKGRNGVNNCTFTLSSFTEVILGADSAYPTKFLAQLAIDGKNEMEVDYSAAYTTLGEPTEINASVLVNPLKLSEKWSNKSGVAAFSTLFENIATSTKIFGFGLGMKGNFETQDVTYMDGYIFLADVAMEGSLNIKALTDVQEKGQELTQELVDANVKLKIKSYSKGNLIATVKVDINAPNEDQGFYIVYASDATKRKSLQEFFTPFLEQLDSSYLESIAELLN